MRRRIFSLATAISLLLCMGTVALWVPSYRNSYEVYRVRRYAPGQHVATASLMVSAGGLVAHFRRWQVSDSAVRADVMPGLHYEVDIPWRYKVNLLGFGRGHHVAGLADSTDWVAVPLWLVVALTATPNVVWLAIWTRRHLRKTDRGFCLVCSYNLTGNASGICPECGTPVPQIAKYSAPNEQNLRPV